MAVYSNGTKTKKQLVSATLAALKDTWASEIKVRDIARACDVSPATVYRHFDSMDHLIAVASVGFVEEFSKSFRALINEGKNIMDIYMGTWTFFNKYAFKRPDVYYPLFWGESNNVFGSAPHDYYELFPVPDSDDWEDKLNTYLASSNLLERGYGVLHMAASQGLITEADAHFLSKTNPLIAQGYLASVAHKSEEERIEREKECDALIRENIKRVYPDLSSE